MAAFPKTKPAFTVKAVIDEPYVVGSHHRKTSLAVVPITGGMVTAEPGFTPVLNATLVGTGNDYIHFDPDQTKLRLDAHSVLKTEDGALIYVHYKGIVNLTEGLGKILSGTSGDLETPYDSLTHLEFETGDEHYKELENGVYVSQGHFVSKTGDKTVLGYRVSQIIKG
ncbi:conserved hypothetical protein [Paecilomyces variotii No. 5]|uniref:Uncharacterized protein n=1 Tax=Byssochlamys spectabilis (strain No. 5 / NBRC 109023) TaxID=1356009 RepID=V5FW60_BYSSN|nr:conserved hypothetical protein [Paecilomyces variotii No. 5]